MAEKHDEMMDGVMRLLERKFREAQKSPKRYTQISMMDLAWVMDTLLYLEKSKEEA